MPRYHTQNQFQQISDINMTPLMDLTFILLITFIITFPLIEQGIPVNLPQGEAQELDPDQTRTISLDLEGKIYLDDLPVTPKKLKDEMTELGLAEPEITIMVRADEGIKYGKLMDVMKILHQAKISRMALVTQSEDK